MTHRTAPHLASGEFKGGHHKTCAMHTDDTAMFTLEEILKATGGRIMTGEVETVFSGITTDSRVVKDGDLFIALKGEKFDGHDFIEDVISKGARGVIAEGEFTVHPGLAPLHRILRRSGAGSSQFTVIMVQDTLRALQDIAHSVRMRYDMPVIGVTGSNGKSTTKEMIASILSRKWNTLKSEGNINNHIGVPLTLLKLIPGHEAVVTEMAMRAEGEIRRLAEIAVPTIGVITNIGPAHLETLGGLDNIARAKAELLEVLNEEGTVVLNNDDPYLNRLDLSKFKGWVVSFGFGDDADVSAIKVRYEGLSSVFSIVVRTNIFDYLLPSVMIPSTAPVIGKKREIKIEGIHLTVPGRHNIYNALAAASVAISLGFDEETIKEGLERFRPLQMRSEVMDIGGRRVINDAYNSNPESLEAALHVLISIGDRGKTIAVLGDMLELGDYKEKAHREVGSKIVKMGIDKFVAVGDLMRYAADVALKEGMDRERIHICKDAEDAKVALRDISREGDTILIKGSRAMGMERILAGIDSFREGGL